MVTLKCARCGRAIEVSDTMLGEEIPCARCGQILAPTPAPDAAATEIGPPRLEGLSEDAFAEDETLIPTPTQKADPSYTFLEPAREPNELGWLGTYRVLSLLGQGAMGIVFKAVDTQLERSIALKVMKPELAQDEMSRARFLREARAMASVKSDHIVAVYQVGQKKHVPFLAMELLQGESLDKRLERQKPLPLDDLLRIGIEIGRGLAAAHERGLIHRDIKPGNIWLEARPEARASETDLPPAAPRPPVSLTPGLDAGLDYRVKILDFGLARRSRDRSNLSQAGMVMGTPAYMAPEQIESKEVDARCDLFSLGCMLYEMAAGVQPFTGSNSVVVMMAVASKEPRPLRELNPQLPAPLLELIQQLLEKDPHKRPATAREVVIRLKAISDTSPAQPLPALTPVAITPPPAPMRLWWSMSLALLGCLLLGGVVSWFLFALL